MAGNSEPSKVSEGKKETNPAIILQCGAYYVVVFQEREEKLLHTLKNAAKTGYEKMISGGTAVDAVEEAVRILEDDQYFNAGRGSLVNVEGDVECDAMIMDGNTMNIGAVMAAKHFFNPVKICRKIMEESHHCAFIGEGALRFAQDKGFKDLICDPAEIIVNEIKEKMMTMDISGFASRYFPPGTSSPEQSLPFDTVSAVAMDSDGHFACATSTGGVLRKSKGRIGDAPLAGCGAYANEFGAAASSGNGESIMKMNLAREVVFNMEQGQNASLSAKNAVERMKNRLSSWCSMIAIDKDGNFGVETNAAGMLWATCKGSDLEFGSKRKEFVKFKKL
ncbi:isoaspartyl peptidase/L-asparaginase-like [Dendronephthya gigantea]|uniref:isoaspartyl peptidase/L-asparaginase-like n=1 Tax=Dendronephthya gigantea TaxID=151771 RepID=UPI0010693C42|nr:isoaspartyl peptidase/L-asparaginase-like [Dendronephthya gigantea]